MPFHFDAHQEYQLQAIEAVVSLLAGQPFLEGNPPPAGAFTVRPNRLDLAEETLLFNLQAVQRQQGLVPDETLLPIEAEIDTAAGPRTVRFPNFSVEMETGTGKTYVYLRTAMALGRRYGLRKYIVVVPSVAVREGVLGVLRSAAPHLQDLYGLPCRFDSYDSDRLSRLREFASSDAVEILVMTLDAFNKAANVIHQSSDCLQGEAPIHLLQAVRPILILDEPQNMESEKSVAALAALDPLLALRYSATHRVPYHRVYRLTPLDAYRQGLVKRIEVASVVEEEGAEIGFLRLQRIDAGKRSVSARLLVHKTGRDGTAREATITVRSGDLLAEKTGRSEYEGLVVEEIHAGAQTLRFQNGRIVRMGEALGGDRTALFEAQIRTTIEEHFRKQARLREKGIKVLSLFFLERVEHYAGEDGIVRRLFDGLFDELKTAHPEWRSREPEEVRSAYFAGRRTRGGFVAENTSGRERKDEEAYRLIMRERDRLLSFQEPVAFLFSHSALREGWDNPNIFQICTLNPTRSEVKKRQEVGRGMRLAVDPEGRRIPDEGVNLLTVVANEHYERYVATLQEEMAAGSDREAIPPRPPNARRRATVRYRPDHPLWPDFLDLWQHIARPTRYTVTVESGRLLADVVDDLDHAPIPVPRLTRRWAALEALSADALVAVAAGGEEVLQEAEQREHLPDLSRILEGLLAQEEPPLALSRRTLIEIFRRTTRQAEAMCHPYAFAVAAVRIIRERLLDQLAEGIRYEPTGGVGLALPAGEEIPTWEEFRVASIRTPADAVVCETEAERRFVLGLERRQDVRLFVRLPERCAVPTPAGPHPPRWAAVLQTGDGAGERRFLVLDLLTPRMEEAAQRRRILCTTRHFQALGVDYRVVEGAEDL